MSAPFFGYAETRANTYVSNHQTQPSTVVLADGSYVVSWASNGQDGSGYGIYAQRFDADGDKIGAEFRVNSTTAHNQLKPVTVALADGGYAIFWEQTPTGTATSGSYYTVSGQRFDANGNAYGSQMTISASNAEGVQATLLSNGALVVIWQDTAGKQIYGRWFDPEGNILIHARPLATYLGYNPNTLQIDNPMIAPLKGGGFVLSWAANNNGIPNAGTDIYVQRYDGSGNAVGSYSAPWGAAIGPQDFSAIVGLEDGGYVVAIDTGGPNSLVSDRNILLQRYNADGTKMGGLIQANTYTSGQQQQPKLIAMPDGGYVVAWVSEGQDGSANGIYAQRYDVNNSKVGGEFRINDTTLNNQGAPNLVARPDGSFIAAWASLQADGYYDVIVKHYSNITAEVPFYNSVTGGNASETLTGTEGRDRIAAFFGDDHLSGNGGDDLLSGGFGDDSLYGGTGNDSLFGGGGDDILVGGEGADVLWGGAGNDIYIIDDGDDLLHEEPGEGVDTAIVSINNYTLPENVEALSYQGTGEFTGYGNAQANAISSGAGNDTLYGAGGNDTLDGGAGADRLIGGVGDDTYLIDDAGDIVIELAGEGIDTVQSAISHTLSANVEILALMGMTAIDGIGNDLANTIIGNAAANRLDGGLGADTLNGGLGDDIYIVDNAGDVVVEAVGQGIDRVETTLASYLLGPDVENLSYVGTSDFAGTGNGLNNAITGGAGADTLDGGAGADTLVGGAGNDVYVIDNVDDVVVERADEGNDTVHSSISHTLEVNVENLVLMGTDDLDGTGNGLANHISGNAGANRLDGGAGVDTLVGGQGDDTYIVDDINDAVIELTGGGIDRLLTDLSSYHLAANVEELVYIGADAFSGTGNELNNIIIGGNGNDTLDGGDGADTLIGGNGADCFIVSDGDVVTDFVAADGDQIDLSATDVDPQLPGRQPFIWLDQAEFTNVAGQLRRQVAGDDLLLLADRDGDGSADLTITLNGISTISVAELVL